MDHTIRDDDDVSNVIEDLADDLADDAPDGDTFMDEEIQDAKDDESDQDDSDDDELHTIDIDTKPTGYWRPPLRGSTIPYMESDLVSEPDTPR